MKEKKCHVRMNKGEIMAEVYYRVGKIVNTQGLRGEVRVLSVTDFPDERFKAGSRLAIFDG